MGPSDKPLFVAGSVLVALLLMFGFQTFLDIKDGHHKGQPETGITLDVPAETTTVAVAGAGETGATAPAEKGSAVDVAALVSSGDAAAGEKEFRRKCSSCHTYKKGDASRLGPNLHGVVDRARGTLADYVSKYSAAMKAKGGTWTLDALNAFIEKPRAAVPGTAMSFAGVKQSNKRADLLAYIKTLTD